MLNYIKNIEWVPFAMFAILATFGIMCGVAQAGSKFGPEAYARAANSMAANDERLRQSAERFDYRMDREEAIAPITDAVNKEVIYWAGMTKVVLVVVGGAVVTVMAVGFIFLTSSWSVAGGKAAFVAVDAYKLRSKQRLIPMGDNGFYPIALMELDGGIAKIDPNTGSIQYLKPGKKDVAPSRQLAPGVSAARMSLAAGGDRLVLDSRVIEDPAERKKIINQQRRSIING